MQWLAELCIRRPVFATMLNLALVVAGLACYWQIGIDRFPKVDLPTVTVSTLLPNASAEEVESEVTRILEDAVATVEGLDELRGISSEGRSLLLLTFNLNRNLDAAAQDVRDALGAVLNRLPADAYPPVVRKLDTDTSPVLSLAVAGGPQRDSRELYLIADKAIKDLIESAPGVGAVNIYGATERAIQVEIDARRLAAYQISITEVRDALIRQNAEGFGGNVQSGAREWSLRTLSRLPDVQAFRDLTVATIQGRKITLADLGRVTDGQKEVRTLARLDGQPAVVLTVQRQSGSNTIEVIQAVKQRLTQAQAYLREHYPDVHIEIIQDQSRYILAALHEIRTHLIVGSILASVVVLLFMRSWRSTLIASVAIPASIIATFAVMRALDFTMNNVTMLALVLMVGVVIDDAIVVLENIFRAMEEKGLPPVQAAIEGTREIGLAVLATTFSLVVVFLPVSFMSSITGRFLYQFGITASVAVLVSLLVSFTLTPMLCSRFLKPTSASLSNSANSRSGFYYYIEAAYLAMLRWCMHHRWILGSVSLVILLSNIPLYFLVQQDYVPTNVDESEFEVNIQAPEGLSIEGMKTVVEAVEEEIKKVGGVVHLLSTVGSTGIGRVNNANIYVRLEDLEQRTFSLGRLFHETWRGQPWNTFRNNYTQRDKMVEIRRRLRQPQFADLRISVRNLTSLRQGAPVDIDFVLTGPELLPLAKYAQQLLARIQDPNGGLEGIVDADITLRLDKPELVGRIDRHKAAELGIDAQEIAVSLRLMVGGDERVSRFRDEKMDDVYDVELRLIGDDRGSKAKIEQLYVRAGTAPLARFGMNNLTSVPSVNRPRLVRLDTVMRFEEAYSPARIDRVDRQRMVAIRGNVAPGYALGDCLARLRRAAAELQLPPGYSFRVLGRGRELERTFLDFAWAFVLSLVFMYIVLAAQFEHFLHPLTILISLPLAIPFGLLSLWWGGETLNLYSALGILVLFGVIKKNSILQVDHTNQLRAAGLSRLEAILQANRDRLRPILMTTLSFVAGMLPLLVGRGPGAEERRSIAVLVVGGQTLSLLLTLLATPVVYSFLDDLAELCRSIKRNRPAEAEVGTPLLVSMNTIEIGSSPSLSDKNEQSPPNGQCSTHKSPDTSHAEPSQV
ncbi:MAG: efflux RND transporter permease subunit [Gemmatales bacterium]|nr:efflux RND transporter permease subunit [Gemmatales bacterium]